MKNAQLTYAQKLAQTNREAKITVVALFVITALWALLGFGLAGLDIKLLNMPLWVWGGTVGTWIVAIIVCVFLARKVFVDFPLDDEAPDGAQDAAGAAASAAAAAEGGDGQ